MAKREPRLLNEFINKADTLQTLSPVLKKSSVEKLFVFNHREWLQDSNEIMQSIKTLFEGKTIIIRSSALSEDTIHTSNAGSFMSVLDVASSDAESVKSAVVRILDSYKNKDAENLDNPVLVQIQTLDCVISGTLLTRDYNGAPYYIINYSEEDTTSVTSGSHSKCVKILKSKDVTIPTEFSRLIEAIKEIEQCVPVGMPLDIEFGIKSTGEVVTFQVRPLLASSPVAKKDEEIFERVRDLKNIFTAISKKREHLAGQMTYFGDMPDWNPAEIIGNAPHKLAATLYDEIITNSVWHESRTSQGYTNVNPAKLVVQFGNKPYVDVRNTFNSFVPASIHKKLREKLLAFYLNKLRINPQLQDKVEFEILFTCYDLSFNRRSEELREVGFSDEEIETIKSALLDLTNNLLKESSIEKDIKKNEELELYRENLLHVSEESSVEENVNRAIDLLEMCKKNGTPQFSRLARLAFIGKILLKSLVEEGIIDTDTYYIFLGSVSTVASQFAIDMDLLHQNKFDKNTFLKKYGHLRPGTYDITVPRYDMSDDYFLSHFDESKYQANEKKNFTFRPDMYTRISMILKEHKVTINAEQLFAFVRAAIEAREYSKFLFSKCLSDAIESIAQAGLSLGFSRDDLANLDMDALKAVHQKDEKFIKKYWAECIHKNKSEYELNSSLNLPPVIFSGTDFEVVSYYESRPNYITNKKVRGQIVILDKTSQNKITGKIVVIESADPGHDWIFTKEPTALITKYGGPASHMAIRCAELGLPAVIGAGELLYDTLLQSKEVLLDCENQKVEPKGMIN